MDKKQKKQKRLDRIGIACGILLVVLAIFSIVAGNAAPVAGVKDSEIPENAVTLMGTADGRNGPVTVEVIADSAKIYRISVTEHQETEGIGTEAVRQLPAAMFQAQNVSQVDAVSGATISSSAIRSAMTSALTGAEAKDAGINPKTFGANPVKVELVALHPDVDALKDSGGRIQILTHSDWEEQYPNQVRTWKQNEENSGQTDYLADYPMLSTLYYKYGFAFDYKAARGHMFDVEDISETARPHGKASCWTCKTPYYTALVLQEGNAAYAMGFEDVREQVAGETIGCFNCHANDPGQGITVTHTYMIDGVGEDFDSIDAANLACGQCHNEYFFNPAVAEKPTTLPHDSLESMHPEAILAFYNDPANFNTEANPDAGKSFADYTNPYTGVRQIKVQHPEIETFLGEGSQHRNTYTCADCHMGTAKDENGKTFSNHFLTNPTENQELIDRECSKCHTDLAADVREIQEAVERRTYTVGYELMYLTERLAAAVESGTYGEQRLEEIRALARDAQFYWDFVFVENSEGAHNSKLTYYCLDKAEELCNQAMKLFDPIVAEP